MHAASKRRKLTVPVENCNTTEPEDNVTIGLELATRAQKFGKHNRNTSEQTRERTDKHYTAWSPELVRVGTRVLNELLVHSHPLKIPDVPSETDLSGNANGLLRDTSDEAPHGEDLEAEIDASQQYELQDLKELCTPLEIDNRCNLCAISSICLRRDVNKKWLLDYSLLCFKCNSAPRTPMSTLIVAVEFLQLMKLHFPDIHMRNIFSDKILTVFDFHMHFFINRCFAKQSDNPITSENITLQHVAVVRSIIMGTDCVPYNKKYRMSLKKHAHPTSANVDDSPFSKHGSISKQRFDDLMFYIWSGTNVFCGTVLSDLAIEKNNAMSSVARRYHDIERCMGPVYLAPTPAFAMKNQTTTICLICELMACSYENNVVLNNVKQQILGYCHNNLKLIDRIQLTLADVMGRFTPPSDTRSKSSDLSSHVSREALDRCGHAPEKATMNNPIYFVFRQVGVTGLYKHFFCDPQCAANMRCTDPKVLFRVPDQRHVREIKLHICCDNNYISPVDRDMWLYIQLFKAFQLTKRNYRAKTQLSDFIREFKHLLEARNIDVIDPSFVVDKYV
uniref:DNA packaging protein UL32 n=1 Tax=Hipposideros bat herpesvirus TaxID=3141919 RepID=A0AAU7E070_9VIRU